MRELLLIAAASFVAVWDVAANQMMIMRSVVGGAEAIARFFIG